MTDTTKSSVSTFLETWSQQSPEPFLERYGALDEAAWEQKLIQSISQPVIDGIAFPQFPPASIQERIHGHSGENAVRESFDFYRVVLAFTRKLEFDLTRKTQLLDFGSGWGRTIRPFMGKIEIEGLFGFEPMPMFCQVARALNPYITFIAGDPSPPTVFGDRRFDLVVSWSVLTHLPPRLSHLWFEEFSRVLRPGGLLFVTIWGERFIETLVREGEKLKAGREIHWYHKHVIETAGDLIDLRRRYRAGQIVFIPSESDPNYGDTFMSAKVGRSLSVKGLELVAFDDSALPQDLLVFRRR